VIVELEGLRDEIERVPLRRTRPETRSARPAIGHPFEQPALERRGGGGGVGPIGWARARQGRDAETVAIGSTLAGTVSAILPFDLVDELCGGERRPYLVTGNFAEANDHRDREGRDDGPVEPPETIVDPRRAKEDDIAVRDAPRIEARCAEKMKDVASALGLAGPKRCPTGSTDLVRESRPLRRSLLEPRRVRSPIVPLGGLLGPSRVVS
jgi:hypothetical protein